MQRGYVKLWRKLEDSGLLQLPNALSLFMILLFRAAYKPYKAGLIEIERGSLIAGRFQLTEWTGLSEQSVRTSLKHLHDMGIIASKPTNKYTIYHIVNYSIYQDNEDSINQQLTNNQPTTNQQLTTIKEINNLNIKEKPYSATSSPEYSQAFLTFWDMYPNRKNKGAAFKAFKKINPAEYLEIKDGLIKAKKSDGWLKDSGQYIPHPASWLNARGWEDEFNSVESAQVLKCPHGYPFSDWMKATPSEKLSIIGRHNVKT